MNNFKINKCILLIGILFIPFHFAMAAKAVSGTLPKVQPLQPLNNMVTPNVGHNINFVSKDLAPALTGTQGAENTEAAASEAVQEENSVTQEKAKPQASSAIYVILILAAAILLVGIIYKKMAHGKK